jgi:hypothetical protein
LNEVTRPGGTARATASTAVLMRAKAADLDMVRSKHCRGVRYT